MKKKWLLTIPVALAAQGIAILALIMTGTVKVFRIHPRLGKSRFIQRVAAVAADSRCFGPIPVDSVSHDPQTVVLPPGRAGAGH